MQVEVKVLLKTRADFDKVHAGLSGGFIRDEQHENYFYDGPNFELSAQGAVLRVRLVNGDKATVALKQHDSVEDGSQVRFNTEVSVPADFAQRVVSNPSTLLGATEAAKVTKDVQSAFGIATLSSLGHFHNAREVYNWGGCKSQPGLTIRLDRTQYPWGERYEIEVPGITVPVHDVIDELSCVLNELGVAYDMGHESKFQHFINGVKASQQRPHMVQEAKLVIHNEDDFSKVRASLSGGLIGCDEQVNLYFDSPDNEIQHSGSQLRLRFVRDKCRAILKEHNAVSDGSALCWAQEEDLALDVANAMREGNPDAVLQTSGPIAQTLKQKFKINHLVCRGGFENTREVYNWGGCKSQPGLTIRLDRTQYPWGERYEIEVPGITVPVHDVIDELSSVLNELGVAYDMGSQSKHQYFMENVGRRLQGPDPVTVRKIF